MRDSRDTPGSAASLLVEGYCQDFIQLAASLAQTLEQVTMRGLPLGESRVSLERVESGMRNLADAIAGMLATESHAPPASRRRGPIREIGRSAVIPLAAGSSAPESDEDNEVVDTSIIVGDTTSMPLTSVFQFLSRIRKTGTLHVHMDEEDLEFDIADGCIENTLTNKPNPGETLGGLLVEMGLAPPDRVVEVTNRVHGGEIEQEAAFVRAGVPTTAVRKALEQLASRRIRRVVKAQHAEYAFDEGRQVSNTERIRIRMQFKAR